MIVDRRQADERREQEQYLGAARGDTGLFYHIFDDVVERLEERRALAHLHPGRDLPVDPAGDETDDRGSDDPDEDYVQYVYEVFHSQTSFLSHFGERTARCSPTKNTPSSSDSSTSLNSTAPFSQPTTQSGCPSFEPMQ